MSVATRYRRKDQGQKISLINDQEHHRCRGYHVMIVLTDEVLQCFRKLHKTKYAVFQDDDFAIKETRKRINDEFRKGKNETDPEKIEELIKVAEDADLILRKTVIQARLVGENRYRLRITKDTHLDDTYPFDPNAVLPEPLSKRKGKRAQKTCEEIQKELDEKPPS